MRMHLNPDAAAAVTAARNKQCRTAMKYLFDAAPHIQGTSCSVDSAEAKAFKQAAIIVAQTCTVDAGRGGKYRSTGFEGARRGRAPLAAARARKTRDEYRIEVNYGYGHGWEHEISEDSRAEGKKRLAEYRANAPQYPVRMVKRRVKI